MSMNRLRKSLTAHRGWMLLFAGVVMGLFANPLQAATPSAVRVVVPEGTVVPVRIDYTLSSATSRVGDRFTATVHSEQEGDAEFPLGTRIEGVVREVQRMGDGQPGMLDLDFRTMRLPDGQNVRVQGSLIALDDSDITQTSDGRLVAKNKKSDRMKFIGYGAGAGLLIGLLTDKTVEGLLLGAVAGYLYSQTRKDKDRLSDVTLKEGTEFGVRLDSAVAYNAPRRFYDSQRNYRASLQRVSDSSQAQTSYSQRADIRVTMNGRAINFGNTLPIEEDGNVLVPLDPVMKAAGTSYDYNERKKVVRAYTKEGTVSIKVGKPFARVSGRKETVETMAQVRDGIIYVPLRFLSLATGMRVMWDMKARRVVMTL